MRLRLLLLLVFLFLWRPAHSQERVVPDNPELRAIVDQARTRIEAALEEQHYPGVSVGLSVDGDLIWAEGFGWSDIGEGVPVTPASRFRIGSISKPLTSTAVAQLVSTGRLDPDAVVQTYVPDFPEKRWPITTRQLGGHLAGIRHYQGDEFTNDRAYTTVAEGLAIFADDSLLFEPGTRYRYSSYGWNLISAVIEAASGESFLDYMRAHVFEALDLESTGPDWAPREMENRVSFYDRSEDGLPVPSPYVDNSYKWAGGGFLSNPTDLVAFGNAVMGEEFLSPSGRALLFTGQHTRDGTETGYGFGWRVSVDEGARLLLGHTGGSVGGTSILTMQPDLDVVFVMLVNETGANLSPARTVMQDILNELESMQ